MVQVEKQDLRGAVLYKLSTDAHWTDIINIRSYDADDAFKPGQVDLSYSSGGALDLPPQDLAQRMVEVWKEAQEIVNREVAKHKQVKETA